MQVTKSLLNTISSYTQMYFLYKNLYTLVLENIQLVVSKLFAGDNRLSPDILLVTTGCHQTKKTGDNQLSADLA